MALEKVITNDYEVRSVYKHIQVRKRTAIVEDGKELSFSYSRHVLSCDMDVSGKSDEVKRDMVAVDTLQKAGKSVNDVPEHVTNALTKDYSSLMKAIDKKKG